MEVDIRNQRQKELANLWLESGKFGIILACPRFGKIRTSFLTFKHIINPKILILYPNIKIENSWRDEFKKLGLHDDGIVYSTFLSLKKHIDEEFDMVIVDEAHLLSDHQISLCKQLFEKNRVVLGLTGTLSDETESVLRNELSLRVVANYPIETAIKEGVITNYQIFIHSVDLDDKILQKFGKYLRTEKKYFDGLTKAIEKLENEGKDTKFLRLNRMRVLQNSIAKHEKTQHLLNSFSGERVLVFCGTIKQAESFNIPSHHSKSKSDEQFQKFINGEIPHLSVIKIGGTGITFLPLNSVIISAFDSNPENLTQRIFRCMSIEYNNPEKQSIIHIVSSTEKTELNWLKKSLSMFSKDKIKWL